MASNNITPTIAPANEIKTEVATYDDKDNGEHGKFKFILSLLKKVIGVTDIISMRISLPSQVLDPIPNLEYFNWLDRPDYFACISEPEDPKERMLAVLRYSFTRYLKYHENKIVKPYNSILGEYFTCKWNTTSPISGREITINMLNEQISHHPPVSALWYECPETGVVAQGNDHITAKFTGTTVKVIPGELARGIYITLRNRDNEEYHLTHGSAYVQGFLSGSLGVGLADSVVISCPATKLRAVIEFKPEKFFGKNKFGVDGALFQFNPTFTTSTTEADLPPSNFKLSDISKSDLICKINGSWRDKIYLETSAKEKEILIDLNGLKPLQKIIKPMEEMSELESRKVWKEVTDNILIKEFSKATKAKVHIEDIQRDKAKKRGDTPWEPTFFYSKEDEQHKQHLKPGVDINY
ncbi:hypothetical protein K502DRAFT_303490 [Neoconidiobolus thromboides FSU 785]|nr:hypothetical protein K502DRAFT_303490 [Neoconidiobolus thromboides FSU 785]